MSDRPTNDGRPDGRRPKRTTEGGERTDGAATTERLRRTAGEKGGHPDTPFPHATPRLLFPSEFPHDEGEDKNTMEGEDETAPPKAEQRPEAKDEAFAGSPQTTQNPLIKEKPSN